MAKMGKYRESHRSNAAARLGRRIDGKIASSILAERNRDSFLNIKNGVFDFGAYQINVLGSAPAGFIIGVPSGNSQAGP